MWSIPKKMNEIDTGWGKMETEEIERCRSWELDLEKQTPFVYKLVKGMF